MTDLQSAVLAMERSNARFQPRIHLVRGNWVSPTRWWVTPAAKPLGAAVRGPQQRVRPTMTRPTRPTTRRVRGGGPLRMEGKRLVVMGPVATIGTSMDALLDNKSKVEEVTGAHALSHIGAKRTAGGTRSRSIRGPWSRCGTAARQAGHAVVRQPGVLHHQGSPACSGAGARTRFAAPAAGVRYDWSVWTRTTTKSDPMGQQ